MEASLQTPDARFARYISWMLLPSPRQVDKVARDYNILYDFIIEGILKVRRMTVMSLWSLEVCPVLSTPLNHNKLKKKKIKTYNSFYSRVVTHHSTTKPARCFNRQIRRDTFLSSVLWSYVETSIPTMIHKCLQKSHVIASSSPFMTISLYQVISYENPRGSVV